MLKNEISLPNLALLLCCPILTLRVCDLVLREVKIIPNLGKGLLRSQPS